jgi:hypothetical protein
MSKAVKIKIYKSVVTPVVVFTSVTWPVAEMDTKYMGGENIEGGT